jgi:predicted secreted protein
MFHDFIAWLVAVFLLGPMQAEIRQQLEAARAPTGVVQQVAECASAAAPGLLARAEADPFWVARAIIGSWVGLTTPEEVLRDAAPGCAPAMAAARPFLG